MNKAARILFAFALLAASALAGAQTYKCEGAGGKVLYSDKPCPKGSKDAGPVEDQISTVPAHKAPPRKTATQGASASKASKSAATKSAAAAPERRCFQVRHVSGTSGIRCNDDPGAPDPVPTDERSKSEVQAK